jgi:putative copper resistance protein D
MNAWYYVSVWLHIICVSFWIGGMLFLPLALLPVIKKHPDRATLLMETGLKFRLYGYIVLGILLLTGITNIYLRGIDVSANFFVASRYGNLVILKFILFLFILAISFWHDAHARKRLLSEEHNNKFKTVARWSGRLMLLISLTMAFVGVVLSRGG